MTTIELSAMDVEYLKRGNKIMKFVNGSTVEISLMDKRKK